MKLFSNIIAELSSPDDQGRDWYGWSSNQCSHALFGVIVALYAYPHPVLAAGVVALFKELFDIAKKTDKKTIKDSAQDVSFWMIGAWLVTSHDINFSVIILIFALLCGIIPRARKAAKNG